LNNENPVTIKMLTIAEASKLIEGLSAFRIRQMCLDGTLPCVKAGRKYLICSKVLYEILCNPIPEQNKNEAVNGITPIY
jgi:hypothetical protein